MTKPSDRSAPLKKATIERGRLAASQANLAEIKVAKLRGELVEAKAVEAE
jgi:phage terminase Nu1 subunit (DNA packaging protein)